MHPSPYSNEEILERIDKELIERTENLNKEFDNVQDAVTNAFALVHSCDKIRGIENVKNAHLSLLRNRYLTELRMLLREVRNAVRVALEEQNNNDTTGGDSEGSGPSDAPGGPETRNEPDNSRDSSGKKPSKKNPNNVSNGTSGKTRNFTGTNTNANQEQNDAEAGAPGAAEGILSAAMRKKKAKKQTTVQENKTTGLPRKRWVPDASGKGENLLLETENRNCLLKGPRRSTPSIEKNADRHDGEGTKEVGNNGIKKSNSPCQEVIELDPGVESSEIKLHRRKATEVQPSANENSDAKANRKRKKKKSSSKKKQKEPDSAASLQDNETTPSVILVVDDVNEVGTGSRPKKKPDLRRKEIEATSTGRHGDTDIVMIPVLKKSSGEEGSKAGRKKKKSVGTQIVKKAGTMIGGSDTESESIPCSRENRVNKVALTDKDAQKPSLKQINKTSATERGKRSRKTITAELKGTQESENKAESAQFVRKSTRTRRLTTKALANQAPNHA